MASHCRYFQIGPESSNYWSQWVFDEIWGTDYLLGAAIIKASKQAQLAGVVADYGVNQCWGCACTSGPHRKEPTLSSHWHWGEEADFTPAGGAREAEEGG